MIVINFKSYKFGKEAVKLAGMIRRHLPNAIVCVNFVDIISVGEVNKKVYSQHVNYNRDGRGTGYVYSNALKSVGARGTLLNHSEHRISLDKIKERLVECKKSGLEVILCAANMREVKIFSKLNLKPYAIAFEDPKLIGSGKSITEHKSKDIVKFVRILKDSGIKSLCGAGISSALDVEKARELGCDGVLIASAIAKVKNPEKLLSELRKFDKKW